MIEAVLLRRAGQQLRLDRRIWDADGKVLAKVDDRPINLGVQDDTQPPDPPRGAGGGRGGQNSRASARWRGAPTARASPTSSRNPRPPASAAGAAARRGAAPAGADDQEPPARAADAARSRSARIASISGRRRSTRRAGRCVYENTTRMTGHRFSPDMQVLFFSERAGQNTRRNRGLPRTTRRRSTRSRAIAPTTSTPIPGSLVSTRGGGGGGGRGGGGGGGGRGGGGGGGPVLLSADGQQRVLPGHGLRPEPATGRAEDLHRPGRDQDRREDAHLRERQQRRLRARLDHARPRRAAGSSSRARARPRCRSSSCVRTAQRDRS